jgi:mono/diheme cytochrome c family protein
VVPPLAGNGSVVAPNPADVINVVLVGMQPHGSDHGPMPSFALQLTDVQIAEITNYLRTSWGNLAPANATPEGVASLRVSAK